MTTDRSQIVRRTSVRVALAATGLVAAVYLAIAVAVVAFVTEDLTSQIDGRLARSLQHLPPEPPLEGVPFPLPPPDRPFAAPVLIWAVKGDGTVLADADNPDLPDELQRVGDPRTTTLEGTEFRLMGAAIGDAYVVVAHSLEGVAQARSTVILAELLIAPVLLTFVFGGAVAIGRRVAAPIERSRRRQLEFTADASHELRTPLSVIEAQTSLAIGRDRDGPWDQTAFGRVDREARRMRRLVDDLLWLARFDASQKPPNSEPVDLGILAAQAADRFAVVAEARRLRLGVHLAVDGAVVAGPPEWLDRLLGVLLDNACKYAPEGGTVDVSVTGEGSRVQLTVDDSGPGIPEEQRERVFDRFHRASDEHGGAGLGLAIADAVVRATGGRWRIGTSPAGGARMSVSWPRRAT